MSLWESRTKVWQLNSQQSAAVLQPVVSAASPLLKDRRFSEIRVRIRRCGLNSLKEIGLGDMVDCFFVQERVFNNCE